MRFELANPQQVILREITKENLTRDSVALTYAFCIRQRQQVDFPTINRAIIKRWSGAALEYIKRKAWAKFEGAA